MDFSFVKALLLGIVAVIAMSLAYEILVQDSKEKFKLDWIIAIIELAEQEGDQETRLNAFVVLVQLVMDSYPKGTSVDLYLSERDLLEWIVVKHSNFKLLGAPISVMDPLVLRQLLLEDRLVSQPYFPPYIPDNSVLCAESRTQLYLFFCFNPNSVNSYLLERGGSSRELLIS